MTAHNPAFLYVEDDAMSCDVVRLLLCNVMGYTDLTIFEDSHDFMARITALPRIPDVIFLDIQMRPHSGYEILTMLREHPDYAETCIIAMTANVMATDVEELKAAGFDGLIGKPIDRKAFPALLDRILQGESVWFVA